MLDEDVEADDVEVAPFLLSHNPVKEVPVGTCAMA